MTALGRLPPLLASLLLALGPAFAPGLGRAQAVNVRATVVRGQATWSGSRSVDGPVTVPAGASLVLAPGARLRFGRGGTLVVEGRLAAAGEVGHPVRLEGARDAALPCIEARGAGAVVRLEGTQIADATAGVVARGGTLTCVQAAFERCDAALSVDLKTRATLEDTTFEGCAQGLFATNGARVAARRLVFRHNTRAASVSNEASLDLSAARFADNRLGLHQEKSSDVRLSACRFEKNATALELHQTPGGPRLVGCTFSANGTGVSAVLYANPTVETSTFADNGVALQASQFCRPVLRRCCLYGNGEAVRLDKHSDARLEGNRVEGNRVGLFADFSSYPEVRGNLFSGNEWHVRLGNFQSADWERRQGGAPVGRERASHKAGAGAPALPAADPAGDRRFSVAGNAWDADTAREMAAGAEANVSRFWDGRDQPLTTDRAEAYAADVILFLPALEARDLPFLADSCGAPAGRPPPRRGR